MASHTIWNGPWPVGATVTAYTRNGAGPIQETAAPPGASAVDAAVVSSGMGVTFDDLALDSRYWAVGQDSSGSWRWMGFATPSPATATIESLLAEVMVLREAPINVDHPDHGGSIESAIALSQTAAEGGAIHIPHGLRELDAPVSIPNFTRITGDGQGTVIRCTGSHYAFAFEPGNRSSLSDLTVDAAAEQTSGGGFDFTGAGFNITIERVWLGDNLHTSLNIAPDATAGVYRLNGLRWNGVVGCNTALKIGGGLGLLTDVYLDQCIGTAATDDDMQIWLDCPHSADTIKPSNCLFINGQRGWEFGTTDIVTNIVATACTLDGMVGPGVNVQESRSVKFDSGEISTCGSSANAGFVIGNGARLTSLTNPTVQNCQGDGIILGAGCQHAQIIGGYVVDNNQSDTASRFGVSVVAGVTDFQILGTKIGNGILDVEGFQRRPVNIATGASDRYVVDVVAFGHVEADTVADGGAGSVKRVVEL